ncbi:Structural maintenance of chromosomes protein 6B [Linum perenne]
MGDAGFVPGFSGPATRTSGTLKRIRVENFMCHSNLQIELGPRVNFITGQNGSGKSAILTAICVAFGSRAKATQRASGLKDFIKTGCSHAVVEVEIKNEGDDAFKHDLYGDAIILERRITQSGSSLTLKDHRGRKVALRKEDLREMIDHFNIDVENPCVVMSQDKSREFLHSGNNKDKFKRSHVHTLLVQFFSKATLLQQVNDLLQSNTEELRAATALVDELEGYIKPIEKELKELKTKIDNMKELEELAQRVQILKKKLAWAWVYDVDKRMQEHVATLEMLKQRVPQCQGKIDQERAKMELLGEKHAKKKAKVARLAEKTLEVQRRQEDLKQSMSMAAKEKLELEDKHRRATKKIFDSKKQIKDIERQIEEIKDQQHRSTQAEKSETDAKIRELQNELDVANESLSRLKEEELGFTEDIEKLQNEIGDIAKEISYNEGKEKECRSTIRELQENMKNKVTAFGGSRVLQLLRAIENHRNQFTRPPIGPIGANLTLTNGDRWALAVENALSRLLNAFIVTDHNDSQVLKRCAREANYPDLKIYIYDFKRPRLSPPPNMLPRTNHPTILSSIHSTNDTVLNVLIDMANAERVVLVEDYDTATRVAFEQRIQNMQEVYTLEGYKMFSRGSVQTVLPPNKRLRTSRLCASFDNQISELEQQRRHFAEEAENSRKRKRDSEKVLRSLGERLQAAKKQCCAAERKVSARKLELQDMERSTNTESNLPSASTLDELRGEILRIQEIMREKETTLEGLQAGMERAEAKSVDLKMSFQTLFGMTGVGGLLFKHKIVKCSFMHVFFGCIGENVDSAKEDMKTLNEADSELMKIVADIKEAEMQKDHYERVMATKVLFDIKKAEERHTEFEKERQDASRKASIICPETALEEIGGPDDSNADQLSAHYKIQKERLEKESQRCPESIDDLIALRAKKERKIQRRRQMYQSFREKLEACEKALNLRWSKFGSTRNSTKSVLTWNFNGHLGKKGISGNIKIDYEGKTLAVEVKMPQDASNSSVRDTRGLSGGERSFSTLCFTLSLHAMIESPFRAMDEFDVFMDAVSRKISMDTLVDFALDNGAQWIFITPHDISMVKQDENIKKQQMAAPRS